MITANPDNLVAFCREYFENKCREMGPSQGGAGSFVFDPDIEALAWDAAQQAMIQYDINQDGKLSKEEAAPMLKSAFEALASAGKLPGQMGEWDAAFHGGFSALDADGSGFLELGEIKRLAKFMINKLRKDVECESPEAAIERIAWEAAEIAIAEFDKNGDGVLTKREALPMIQGAFEMLQKHGKLRDDMGDINDAYEEAFAMLDVDESGTLEVYELKRLCKFLFANLVQ